MRKINLALNLINVLLVGIIITHGKTRCRAMY